VSSPPCTEAGNVQESSTEGREGFWWRIDSAFEKVLLFGSNPVGVVAYEVRAQGSNRRWRARTSTGRTEKASFADQPSAIAFVEAAMGPYLAFREYRRRHPGRPDFFNPYR